MTKRTPPFSPEVRERAVRMVLEHQGEHDSQYGAIRSIAAKIGCSGETLRNWVRSVGRRKIRPRGGVNPGHLSFTKPAETIFKTISGSDLYADVAAERPRRRPVR